MNTSEKDARRVIVAVLATFAFANCLGAVDGALSKMAQALNVDHTLALYAGSIPALASVPASLLLGFLAGKRIPYKTAAIACGAVMIAAGVLPVFADSFVAVLAARCLFGLGLGGMMSITNPLATKLIPEDKRAAVLGAGTCVAFASQCILQLVGGILADISWNLVFLTHVLLALPLVVIIALLPAVKTEPASAEKRNRGKVPLPAALMCVVIGVVTMILSPLLFGSAFYVAALDDSATVAAIVAMLFSIGSMAGGLAYPLFYRFLKRRSFAVFLLIGALGLVISANATSVVVLCVGFFIGGISFASMQAGTMMLIGLVCPRERVGFTSALMMVCLNLGGFLCSSWEAAVGALTGDALYAPLLIGAALFVVLAAALAAKPPFPAQKAQAEKEV